MERHIRDPPREQQPRRPPVGFGNQLRPPANIIDRLNAPIRGIGLELDPLPDRKEIPPKRHGGNTTAKERLMTEHTTGQQATAGDRFVALKSAYPLLNPGGDAGVNVFDLIRLAEYIVTGADYLDTHPVAEAGTEESDA